MVPNETDEAAPKASACIAGYVPAQEVEMGRIIIDNRASIDDALAVGMVKRVIEDGRISNGGKQYCYYTVFTGEDGEKIGVATDLNKRSDRFVLVDDQNSFST